jgi:YVTN family beta-propeller protein
MNKENTVNRLVGCRCLFAAVFAVLASLSVYAQEPLKPEAGNTLPVNQVIATIQISTAVGNEYQGYFGLAVTPDNKYLYVTAGSINALYTVDAATNSIIGNAIATSNNPQLIAVTPNGKTLYIADVVGNNMQGIDGPGALTVVKNVSTTHPAFEETVQNLGQWPYALAINNQGTLIYIANYVSNFISVFDIKENQLLPVPLLSGNGPVSIAFTPNGKYAYVCNSADNTVMAIDTAKGVIVGSPITVGTFPGSVVIAPNGKKAYVRNLGSGTESVIDTATNTVSSTITVSTAAFSGIHDQEAVTPDGKYLYTPVYPGMVVMVSTEADSVVGTPLTNFDTPDAIAIAPDGKRAYIVDDSTGILTVLNITGKMVTPSAP